MKRDKQRTVHPFLIGVYPVVALLAHNFGDVGLFSSLRSLLLTLAITAIILWLATLILRNHPRAAMVTSFLLLLMFYYGHVFNLIENAQVAGIDIGRHSILATFWSVLLIVGVWVIIKKIKTPQRWIRPLNIFSCFLLLLPIIQITSTQVSSMIATRRVNSTAPNSLAERLSPPSQEMLPDIYYIILDTYTRADALQEVFNYDNSSYLNSLENRGFIIGTCSQSNYRYTEASLTSSLNMQYLDSLSEKLAPPNQSIEDMKVFLQNSNVFQTLQDLGYQSVVFESGYKPTEFQNADIYLSPQRGMLTTQLFGGLNPFEAMLLRTTAGRLALDLHMFPRGLENTLFNSAYLIHRARILYELEKVTNIPSIAGPKITFVHILAPHNPFVFGPEGEVLMRTTPFTLNMDVDASELPAYITGYDGQVSYLNMRTLEAVDTILYKSENPPIIIIQGDHGSPRIPGWNMAILNAYYFPDEQGRAMLYPSISPVNTFRVIINAYLGGSLDLLPDKACNSSEENPYECLVLADPNPHCASNTQ
jgi:hypothetical protein